jgi:hypothetical protein
LKHHLLKTKTTKMNKKLLSLYGVLLSCTGAFAQITVNATDLAPLTTQVYQANDTLAALSIVPGTAGANQTWNFSALHTHKIDTLVFDVPTWTPYSATYPSANVALETNKTGIAYLKNNASGLYAVGAAIHVKDPANHVILAHYAAPTVSIQWPAVFGATYKDSAFITGASAYNGFAGIDTVKIKNTGRSTYTMDAWGSMQTPFGTFPVLRQHKHTFEIDSTWAHQVNTTGYFLVSSKTDTIDHYTWWTNSSAEGYPVAAMDYKASTAKASNVTWLMTHPTAQGIAEQSTPSFSVYPNPAAAVIHIRRASAGEVWLSLSDMTGREVLAPSRNSGDFISVSVDELQSGVYFLTLTSANGARSVKKISVQH